MSVGTGKVIAADRLRAFCTEVYRKAGLPEEDARVGADALVEADLRGVDTHGVMLQAYYVDKMEKGEINPRASIRVVGGLPAFVHVDGDAGLGHVVSYRAMQMAMDRADQYGIGAVAVSNSSHNGMIGYYAMQAPARDMIGFCTTSTGRCMPAFGGLDRITGNNPQAWAIPAGKDRPIVVDMSHSVVPAGKIRVSAWKGEKIPEGWAVTPDGDPVTDPNEALRDLTLLPFGGPKGYALATAMEALGGILTGSTMSDAWLGLQGVGAGANGQFFMALKVEAIMPLPEYRAKVDRMIEAIHASRPAKGFTRVLAPGEPEFDRREQRLRDGIFLIPATVRTLQELGARLGVEAELA